MFRQIYASQVILALKKPVTSIYRNGFTINCFNTNNMCSFLPLPIRSLAAVFWLKCSFQEASKAANHTIHFNHLQEHNIACRTVDKQFFSRNRHNLHTMVIIYAINVIWAFADWCIQNNGQHHSNQTTTSSIFPRDFDLPNPVYDRLSYRHQSSKFV